MEHRFYPNILLENLSGIEIGALHLPYRTPKSAKIEYMDVRHHTELKKIFKEINKIVHNKYVFDISQNNIPPNLRNKYDFAIANHVLEHVPNPIFALKNLFDLVKDDGYVFLSVPDKSFSYDCTRNITPFEHVLADYFLENFEQTTDHIVDFLIAIHPDVFVERDKERFLNAFKAISERKDHLHVWDSAAFRDFLTNVFSLLKLDCTIVYESRGEANKFEYFCVLKLGKVDWNDIAARVIQNIYEQRADLKHSFKNVDFAQRKNASDFINWIKNCDCDEDIGLQIAKQYIEYI